MNNRNHVRVANAFKNDILGDFVDATSISEAIKSKEISPEEVVKTSIDRVKEINPIINAVASNCYEEAIEYSKSVKGELAGIPIFLKDQVDMKGLPTFRGSRSMPQKAKKKSEQTIHQIQSTGIVILGKSTCSEMGILPCGETMLHGNTLNPRNIEYSTGGSSAGSAALVASGAVPISHAMDGGGSIRVPASCCGLIGLKPTKGRHIDIFTNKLPIDFAEQGIVSRSVRDTANYFAAIEKFYKNPNLPAIGKVEQSSKRRLRIAIYTDTLSGAQSDSDVVNATLDAGRFCEQLGHEVTLITNPFDMQFKLDFTTFYTFLCFISKYFGITEFGLSYNTSKLEPFTKYLANLFPLLFVINPLALKRLKKFDSIYEAAFDHYDVLLCPTLSITVPKIGYWDPNESLMNLSDRLYTYVHSTIVQNISGSPAISLPMGTCRNGLPIGIQFAAKQGEERRLLELAFELEENEGFQPFLDKVFKKK